MTEFEIALFTKIDSIREQIKKIETISSMELIIDISGRVDGDIKVAFKLFLDYGDPTRGGTLDAVVSEAMRRKGWSDCFAPICLPNVKPVPGDA